MYGICQGNGAGPAKWGVLSTPLLNLLRSKGFGLTLISPISQKCTKFVGYSFVDDIDIIQTGTSIDTYIKVLQGMQHSVDTWESGLKATCGPLLPEKTI
jgi:hypothetical protein